MTDGAFLGKESFTEAQVFPSKYFRAKFLQWNGVCALIQTSSCFLLLRILQLFFFPLEIKVSLHMQQKEVKK